MVQVLDAGSLVKHRGDYALAQHVKAFQKSSMIGRDYGGISDNHNMVVVVGKPYAVEKRGGALEPIVPAAPTASRDVAMRPQGETHSGASEPNGSTGPRDVAQLTEAAKRAAQNLADMLEDQPKGAARRKARDGYLYTHQEFLDYYGEDAQDQWEQAVVTDEYKWGTTDVNSVLGRALWPRETPRMMMVEDGAPQLAAATCPPAAVVEHLFKTLLRVRQAEFEAQAGVPNPDAWDTDAADPRVPVDLGRELNELEFGSAYGRWRDQWVDRIKLHDGQEMQRQKLSKAAFCRKTRSWFEAWLKKYLGNRHAARAVIRYGTTDVAVLTCILDAIDEEKKEEAKKRLDAHGAGEPVWKLKLDAHLARKALRDGERLARKIQTGKRNPYWLSPKERQLLDDFNEGRLHVRVDQANEKYGHGIARTNDFGFRVGENMCRDIPIEVRAHLRTLQRSAALEN